MHQRRAKRQKKSNNGEEFILPTLLKILGVSFSVEEHVLCVDDPFALRRVLSRELRDEVVLSELKESLFALTESEYHLRVCLSPVKFTGSARTFGSHESIVRILLEVDAVQQFLADLLLEKLPCPPQSDASHFKENIPLLILQQFRWLNNISDSVSMTEKLLEVLEVCTDELQREIISAIPEIVDDYGHEAVVNRLRDMMESNSNLTKPIIDALANLNLQPPLLKTFWTTVLFMLPSADLEELPVVIRFLLQSVHSREDIETLVKEIRENLILSSMPGENEKDRSKRLAGESLTLSALRTGIRFNKMVTKEFLKQIKSVSSVGEHTSLDIWVLFILYSIQTTKKAVEQLFRKKIQSKLFTVNLLENSITDHAPALNEYFPILVSLSACFLRSSVPEIREFGKSLYTITFRNYTDKSQRTTILDNVKSHIGSGSIPEVDAALVALDEFIQHTGDSMLPYTQLIERMLYYTETLSDCQIRRVFSTFGKLALIEANSSNIGSLGMLNKLEITIKKHLHSPSEYMKMTGVIAGVATVSGLLTNVEMQDRGLMETSTMEESKALELIEVINRGCKGSGPCTALLYDEMFSAFGMLEFFLPLLRTYGLAHIDRVVTLQYSNTNPNDVWLNLEVEEGEEDNDQIEDNTGIHSVVIYPLLEKSSISPNPLVFICSVLKWISTLLKKEGQLREIDTLLTAPLIMYDYKEEEEEEEKEKEKQFSINIENETSVKKCLSLVYSLNWLREIVNAFSDTIDENYQRLVVSRLQHIRKLEGILEDILSNNGSLIEPLKREFRSSIGTDAKISLPKKGKKKEEYTKKINNINLECTNVNAINPLFREFELHVATILTYSYGSHEATPLLEISALHYILKDLNNKLAIGLAPPKQATFLSKQKHHIHHRRRLLEENSCTDVMNVLKPVFPALFHHLKYIATQIRRVSEEKEEGEEEEEDLYEKSEEEQINESYFRVPCINLMLQCFTTVFQCDALFETEDKCALVRDIIGPICEHNNLKNGESDFASLFEAFASFSDACGISGFTSCVQLVSLLSAIVDRTPSPQIRQHLSDISGSFLQANPASKPKPSDLELVLHKHIMMAKQPIETLENVILCVIPANGVHGKGDNEDDTSSAVGYNTLNSSTFPVYFKVALRDIVTLLQNVILQDDRPHEAMKPLESLFILYNFLLSMAKDHQDTKRHSNIMVTTLKESLVIVQTFVKKILPFLSKYFRAGEEATTIITIFQKGTRDLHRMCAQGKINKETALVKLIPPLKKSLEEMLHKVIAFTRENNPADAIRIGTLRPRDLRGCDVPKTIAEEQQVSASSLNSSSCDDENEL